MKSYRARFFRLERSILYYYVDDARIGLANIGPGTKPRGTIYLAGCTITREPPREPLGRLPPGTFEEPAGGLRAYPFTIRHPASPEATRLATDSEGATAAWVAFLTRAAHTSHLGAPSTPGRLGLEPGTGVGAASPAPTNGGGYGAGGYGAGLGSPPPAAVPFSGYGAAAGGYGAAPTDGYQDIDLHAPQQQQPLPGFGFPQQQPAGSGGLGGVSGFGPPLAGGGGYGSFGEAPAPTGAPPPPPGGAAAGAYYGSSGALGGGSFGVGPSGGGGGGGSDAASVLTEGVWTALVSEPLEAGGGVLGGNKNVCTVALRLVRRGVAAQPAPPAAAAAGGGAMLGGAGSVAATCQARLGWAEEAGHVLSNWGVAVQRREKDFARLHEYLSHEVGASTLPKLPSRGGGVLLGGGSGGSSGGPEMAKYRERLQRYLESLLCQPALANSHALKVFFSGARAGALGATRCGRIPRWARGWVDRVRKGTRRVRRGTRRIRNGTRRIRNWTPRARKKTDMGAGSVGTGQLHGIARAKPAHALCVMPHPSTHPLTPTPSPHLGARRTPRERLARDCVQAARRN